MRAECDRSGLLAQALADRQSRIAPPRLQQEGRVTELRGLTLVVEGCRAPVGSRCRILSREGEAFEAEVVGFADSRLYLMPIGNLQGLGPGATVHPLGTHRRIPVGRALLGRVIGATGEPLDGKGPLRCDASIELKGAPINPFSRAPINESLDIGVRSINALCTVGRGQRLGLFAGSGVGKSTLLGQMTRFTSVDVVVVGLIGERGREVREFVESILGSRDCGHAVVVAAPADDPPLMRIHGAWRATAIAEYFRQQGLNVLLLMDSLTRFAQAQREIALAIGEPPVTRGYPPSVFVEIPRLVERSGNGSGEGDGSITALYTVLVEGDDQNEPIADATRAILDGHVVLSRKLAESAVYPAVDIEASVSRVMTAVTSPEHQSAAARFRQVYATYQQNRDLIAVGAYEAGADPQVDLAIEHRDVMKAFLCQGIDQCVPLEDSRGDLLAMSHRWGDAA